MDNFIRIFCILLFLTGKSFAYDPEEGQVTATLGPYYSKTNLWTLNSKASSTFSGGVGLIAVGDINEKGSLEIGMFYMPQMFFREQDQWLIAERTQVMHISMGYRRWINPYFSSSLSLYSSYSMGDPQIVYNDFPQGLEVNTSAHDTTEYGIDWAVQGDLWSDDKIAVVLEGRYSFSITSKSREKADQYGFLLGLRYLVQEEKKVEHPPL
ncbi:MAG: hypothetical protein ACXWRA_09605 [Pseudobdellovibrionaceae bacterium]